MSLLTSGGAPGVFGEQGACILGRLRRQGGASGWWSGLLLADDHTAVGADCERLSAQIEEYILCGGGSGLGF